VLPNWQPLHPLCSWSGYGPALARFVTLSYLRHMSAVCLLTAG